MKMMLALFGGFKNWGGVRSPHNKDHSTFGSILGPQILWNPPDEILKGLDCQGRG